MESIVAKGAFAAASPIGVAERSDMVFLCVDSADAVEQIIFGPDGIASASDKPKLIIDNSTIHPLRARLIAERAAGAGLPMIDCPVSGGAIGAQNGTLAVMAGGDAADVDAARPVILSYASRVTHMGPSGAGQATKACNQIINFTTVAGIAEAVAFGKAFGLDTAQLPEALAGGFADSNMLREYARATAAAKTATSPS